MFSAYPYPTSSTSNVLVYAPQTSSAELKLIGISDSAPSFTTTSGTKTNSIPGRLRIADIDSDSFPDIVVSAFYLNTTSSSYLT